MKTLFKLVLFAAVGAAIYFVVTSEDEEGLDHDIKALVNEVVTEGKKAAEQRRTELETELGYRPNGRQAA